MSEDKDLVVMTPLPHARVQKQEVLDDSDKSQKHMEALRLYRHFVDRLNQSSECDIQVAELRS